jgi:hypothetical protein
MGHGRYKYKCTSFICDANGRTSLEVPVIIIFVQLPQLQACSIEQPSFRPIHSQVTT